MYTSKTKEDLVLILKDLNEQYALAKEKGLKLDMSRGKPSPEQLDISQGMLDVLDRNSSLIAEDGTDCRNYGAMDGIPEMKRLIAPILDVEPSEVFIGNGSCLNLMHDLVGFCWLHAAAGSDTPWGKQGKIKFLCPSPGYDRHFAATAHYGIRNIPVPMNDDGPDMDVVERLVAEDASIKGMWCVPKYSNPTGVVYSDETVRRLAAMKPAAKDFRIFWDNAYAIHDIYEDCDGLLPLLPELKKNGNEDMAFLFCSFSKVTFGGAGVVAAGASANNIAWIKKHMNLQIICNDKINQLRHARFFGDFDGLLAHMKKHAEMLRPKFEIVQEILERELGGLGIATWSKPRGGYFISLDLPAGCAKRTVALCKEAGVVMTPAGATFPYGEDPDDSNIRIAPTYPSIEELAKAAELLSLCAKIAAAEKAAV